MGDKAFSEDFNKAWELHTKALCVIPSGGGSSGKAPIVNWTEYQRRLSTDDELLRWNEDLQPRLWGIVTGLVSRLVVIDVDSPGAMAVMGKLKPHVRTPRGGAHYYFRHPGNPVKTVAGILPKIDIRADGGFVNAVGGKYEVQVFPTAETVYRWDQLPGAILKAITEPIVEKVVAQAKSEIIPPGTQDHWLYKRACGYRAKGDTIDQIVEKLRIDIKRCPQDPNRNPYTDADFKRLAESAGRHPPGKLELEPDLTIDEPPNNNGNKDTYISNTSNGQENDIKTFQNRDKTVTDSFQKRDGNTRINYSAGFNQVLKDAGKMSRRDIALSIGISPTSDTFRQIVKRRLDDKQIRPYRGSPEVFEWVNKDYKILSLSDYKNQVVLSIKLPFGLNNMVKVPAGSVVGIAGYTSAGKTGTLLEIADMNIAGDMDIYYWFNEMSEERMLSKLDDYPGLVNEMGKKFKAIRQTDFEFYDVLVPNAINLIDYLDLDGEGEQATFMIGAIIKKIARAVGGGIVIFGVQKPENRDIGYGGIYSVKLTNLYLALDAVEQKEKSMIGRCKIVKAKDWEKVNPVNMVCNYYTSGKHGKIFSDNLWRREDK
jgi:hypothetical protein